MKNALCGEIIIRQERRPVAVTFRDGSEHLGFFHRWVENTIFVDTGNAALALVELADGTVSYWPDGAIRFLPTEDMASAVELEEIYRKNEILKG